jgi:histidinol-phosphatase (PHP family)
VTLSSLHTHSRFCDGHGELEEYVVAARDAGLAYYGASGHAPLPFACDYAIPLANLDLYVAEVRRLQAAYRGRVPVLLGLELDYLPGLTDFYARELFSRGLEYVVASVHYVGEPGVAPWVYDESEERFAAEIQQRHGGNARPAIEDYFRRIVRMVGEAADWPVPVIVGHLDRISIWNRGEKYFAVESDWYQAAVDAALDAIAESRCVLELNASGWNKTNETCNPSPAILRRAAARGIPVIVSADAHRPQNVNQHYDRALGVLREAGFQSLVYPIEGGWESTRLAE